MSQTRSNDRVGGQSLNVLGSTLEPCSSDPATGFYRNGCCDTGAGDVGLHVVCAQMTEGFLEFTQSQGNDLSTPVPEFGFPGLKPGDRWCLCISRWIEAANAGVAPPLVLESTHEAALIYLGLDDLREYSVVSQE